MVWGVIFEEECVVLVDDKDFEDAFVVLAFKLEVLGTLIIIWHHR